MRLLQAIENANTIRPNAIPDHLKAAWVYELEGQFAEMMGVEMPDNAYDGEMGDAELLMPFPKDRCYELFVCAMIDSTNQEMDLYNHDIEMANAAIDDACAWWRRHHTPKRRHGWRTLGHGVR